VDRLVATKVEEAVDTRAAEEEPATSVDSLGTFRETALATQEAVVEVVSEEAVRPAIASRAACPAM
jgi:hypothetical protein